ncbi:hypothetical protein ANCCEY_08288 [Ancylostoma ceylanicum]|uniref:NAD(+) ADP-ribosyltransferase n=1 Tax=Ancylostoma ceylanicum TaxID=53326 RepID=A0A0D6LN61_9BILA|nr:hypothetical protein ANCCEY_08288 [Ancylostoma ceylanicum]
MSGGAGVDWHDEMDIPKMELLNAAYEGNITKVAELLRMGVNIDSCDDDHVTALQIAAFNGNNSLVTYLLDEGADLEACNQVGMTPFHHACREGKMTVVETLLQRGADIHRTTYMGATALTLAAAGAHLHIVKKLVSLRLEVSPPTMGLCPTPLIAAAFRSSPQICGFLNHRGAPIDETLDSLLGLSALSCVLMCSSTSVFCALLDLGADPTKKTLKKKTAAELAEQFKRHDVLAILADKSRIRHHDESDPSLRAMLHTCRPSRLDHHKMNLSASSGTLSKVLNTGRPKVRLENVRFVTVVHICCSGMVVTILKSVRPVERVTNRFEYDGDATVAGLLDQDKWDRWSLLAGELVLTRSQVERCFRNFSNFFQKLVTAEEILRMTKNATPLKNVTYDTVLDAVKKMAQQSQSFAVNCFYDSYVGEVKRGDADNESDSYKSEYYDRAQMYTSQCGYQQSKRRVINPRDSIVVHRREGSDGSRKPRTLSFLESPSQNQMRTTPRMLKKSRESMVMDETVTRSGYEQLRKTASTPLLVQVPTMLGTPHVRLSLSQSERRRTVEDRIWGELRKHGLMQYVEVLQKEEIDAESFFTLNDHDLKNMGITSSAHRAAILNVKNHLISIS